MSEDTGGYVFVPTLPEETGGNVFVPTLLAAPTPVAAPLPTEEVAAWLRGDGWRVALREDGSVAVQRRCRDWPGEGPATVQVEVVLTAAEWRRLVDLFAEALSLLEPA